MLKATLQERAADPLPPEAGIHAEERDPAAVPVVRSVLQRTLPRDGEQESGDHVLHPRYRRAFYLEVRVQQDLARERAWRDRVRRQRGLQETDHGRKIFAI